MNPSPMVGEGPGDGFRAKAGFALIIVLWGLVLIGLLITHLTATGRYEARIAANEVSSASAATAADGGIHMAVFYLTHSDPRLRWSPDGAVHDVTIGGAKVTVQIHNDGGLINPNLAPVTLMAALFRELGADAGQASGLASALESWRDMAVQMRVGGVGERDYQAAGKNYGPPGSPMEDLDEMGRILGMTPELAASTRPHLSLWNLAEFPLADVADPVVAKALDQAAQSPDNLPPAGAVRANRLTVTVRASATVRSGASFVRQAVLRVGPGLQKGYQILAWERLTE
ncbi:type II secretion system protein GspK [Telmatospirillum sp.]|uniref:general secretion pathway protein GspK n=1 Tax=Telmatospirillum sp. TaxID=2079197 RepID=UPI002840A2FB|nr:type II secretion system protein GspK [Telmatospirillum sp.]MDR3436834.1 type II secretion system protein GspK [Telmatospirillum sp.]